MRRLRPPAALAVTALMGIALTGAGCGSSAPSQTTGTAKGSGAGAGTTSTARDKAVRFAECMRDKGVSAFPDPDAAGELTIDAVANGTSVDLDSAAFKQAISACKELQPSGFIGRKRNSQQQDNALKFAQCIRANGVKDFPDPAIGEPLVDTRRIPSTDAEGGMSVLNAAMRKCGGVLGNAVTSP